MSSTPARVAATFALIAAASAPAASAQPAAARGVVPTPASVLGFEPGTDRRLPEWRQVVEYFSRLDRASDRVTVRTLGRTTLGRPFIAAFISDAATLRDLSRLQAIQARLADPRRQAPGERARLEREGRVVVLVTSSIHSTEVGGILTPLRLAYRLATGEDEETRRIRANTLVILVPSLNPDGVDIVGSWYRETLGTPAEGTVPPVVYHKYTGHDNNRDWYAFTQVETRLTVDSLHNVWHPAIVNDIHQQGSSGARIFIPPYLDPVEPNVDPLLTAGVNAMGTAMAWRLTTEGKAGVAVNTAYDAWTPARAYQHYHGGIRILTETASARIATPITVAFDSLRRGLNDDARVSTWNAPAPWPGGRWTVGDIVAYQTSATWALLATAASERDRWQASFAEVAARAVQGRAAPGRGGWPTAFVLPAAQRDTAALESVLRILQRGMVEVRRATATGTPATLKPDAAGCRGTVSELDACARSATTARVAPGDYVIFTAQPYGAFAKALLERQRYPDIREYPGGPPREPYDVTAQTLPLLMGVDAVAIRDSLAASAPIAAIAEPRLTTPPALAGRRIAVYRSWAAPIDEGWTRWVLDRFHVPFTTIGDRDVRAGDLGKRFDVVIVADQSSDGIARGVRAPYPDSLRGGLGDSGAVALRLFVGGGGTLVSLNRASRWAIPALGLPVRDVLANLPSREFFGPGSILRAVPDRTHPMGRDARDTVAVWFEESPAFAITDASRARSVLSYPPGDPLLSGWLLGGDRLAGASALVDVTVGTGHVLLFGFRPQYRGQSEATYPLLWAALAGRATLGGAGR